MSKKKIGGIVIVGVLLLLGIIAGLIIFLTGKQSGGKFSTKPVAYIGFDGEDTVSYQQPNVEVVDGMTGKGAELASALNSSVIIDEKGFAKNLNGAETVTISMWIMPYSHRVSGSVISRGDTCTM